MSRSGSIVWSCNHMHSPTAFTRYSVYEIMFGILHTHSEQLKSLPGHRWNLSGCVSINRIWRDDAECASEVHDEFLAITPVVYASTLYRN